MNKTIALAMIVRNEAERLAKCLDSVKSQVDEIVIVDTGSSDNTVDVARQYTEKVMYYAWDNDFSAARNFAIAQTNSAWILSLDADEQLDVSGGDLRALVGQNEKDAFCLPLLTGEINNICQNDRFMVLRFFKNTYRFCGAIHEQILVEDATTLGFAANPVIRHVAIPAKERRRRRGRNIALLQKAINKEPDNPFLIYYYGVDWLGLGRLEKAAACFERVLGCLTDEYMLFRTPALRYLINCYKIQGELDKAICLCLDESMRYREYSDLYFEGGILFELKGEYQIAAKWFNEALQHDKPPAVFHHTDGTESYLSLYHLGCCLEQLGAFKQARECYLRALAANKRYVDPLYQLIQMGLSRQSAASVWEDLRKEGYLTDSLSAANAAESFWKAGFPDLAYACLIQAGADVSEALIKYAVYSGHHREAIAGMEQLRSRTPVLSIALAVDEIMAWLMVPDLKQAKVQALDLWKRPEGRNAAWAMLNVAHLLEKGSLCGIPEPYRQEEVTQVLINVLVNCWHSRAKDVQMQASLANIMTQIVNILLLQPQHTLLLSAFLQDKADRLRRQISYNFEAARGLYV